MFNKIRLQNILKRAQRYGIGPKEQKFLEDSLLYKYDDDTTYLEYIIDYYPDLLESFDFPFPKGNPDVAYILAKNRIYTQLKKANKNTTQVAKVFLSMSEDDLFKIYDSKFLIHYILKDLKDYNLIVRVISTIENHTEIIDFLKDSDAITLLSELNPILVEYIFKEENGHAIIEKYLSNDYIFLELLKRYPYKSQVLDICKKYNKEHLINQVFENEYISQLSTKLNSRKFQMESTGEIDSDLISEFEKLFKDGMREDELKILVTIFKEALLTENDYAHQLLSIVVEEKKKDSSALKFIFTEGNSNCSRGPGPIQIEIGKSQLFPGTLFHEVGHFIHNIKGDLYVPDDIINMVLNIRENFHAAMGEEVQNFVTSYEKTRESITQLAIKEFESHVKITDEEFEKYLERLSLPPEAIKHIKKVSNKEEIFIEKCRDYYIKMYMDYFLRCNYPEFTAISDIVDAIFGGLFRMNGYFGHGVNYYTNPNKWFIEMVANYIEILCSPGCDFYLNVLKTIIGDEMFKLLDDYCQGLLNTNVKKKTV